MSYYCYYCNECDKNFDEPDEEVWQDPGVYPSNAGSSPLPSYTYKVCPYCGSDEVRKW